VASFAVHLMRRLCNLLLVSLVVVGFAGSPAYSHDLSPTERAELEAKKSQLFQQSLRDPGNLDVTFAYADAAAKLGDNEAAVSALERMLLFNPNLPRVQLELGALYFRMGSYDIARTYFERAAASNPPHDVAERIHTYLSEISRRSAPQRISGYAFVGAQYQTDANIAGSSSIALPGVVINLLPQFTKRRDYNFFATGSVLYSYDLGNQTADTLEVATTGYINHYGVTERLNLGLLEATAGPRFNFPEPLPGVSSASLKPYVIGNEVTLGNHQYFDTWGVGGESTALAWEDLRVKSTFEYRQKTFTNAPDRPLSNGFNGSDKLVTLTLNKPITVAPASDLTFEFDFLDQDTISIPDPITPLPVFSNKSYAGAVAYHLRYDDPTKFFRYPLETNFAASRSWANYAAPDPCCGVASNRFDRRWRLAVAQTFPVTADVAVVLQLQRDIVSSNVPLYHYTNNTVLLGTQVRF
jgi:tetratricopeptide (TPR) repeat protein